MKLDRYLRALVHYWYILAIILGVGLLGTWMYLRLNRSFSAAATVAVLEPAVTSALGGQGQQAQVNFASVVESLTVSDKTLYVYDGLYHEIYNEMEDERQKVLGDLETWLEDHVT